MVYLAFAVALVGAVSLLNLVLAAGIIRRLREHTDMLQAAQSDQGLLGPGDVVGDFATHTVAGERFARADLSDDVAVAFFSPTCQPCRDVAPRFAKYAAGLPAGRGRAVAVVLGEPEAAADMVATLIPDVEVVTADAAEPLVTAFRPRGYPSIYWVSDGGVVKASGRDTSILPHSP